MRRFLIALALFFIAFYSHAQTIVRIDTSKQLIVTLTIDTTKCKERYTYNVISIKVISRKTGKELAVSNFHKDNEIPCFGDIIGSDYFQIVDANFDGYEDILLLQFLPAAPNLPYFYWIYNPKSKQFEEDTSLENITSPEFDLASRTIGSTWRGSCCDHGHDTYQYIMGKITLIEQSELISDEESKTDTMIERKFIDGKLKEVSREVEKEGK